ncbi:MAG: hypothetical protein JRD03_00210 [Deltaproteobacteria bacterium]|nr:hypothetical protein [Deltaproteobacteria bacterium]
MRSQGAKGVNVTRDRSIGRRDFLTRFFRGPGRSASSMDLDSQARSPNGLQGAEDTSLTCDTHRDASECEEARASHDLTAPECTPESLADESNMESVLKELHDWTGIMDP